jgi:non-specific protein-tyrosine kinase
MKLKSLILRFRKNQSAQLSAPAPKRDVKRFNAKDEIGWFSPAYDQSRAVELDVATMEKNRLVAMFPDSREIDFYKVLRTRISHRTRNQEGRAIMITSALPGEGKTVTAINLALTFAREFEQTVLLVDGDLRKQSIHEQMGFRSNLGLLDYLLDDKPVPDLIVWPGIEKLTVISGGRTITESSEIIGSPKMRALVEEMKNRYTERYVFFDVSPVLAGADAIVFASLVDWIVMVVQAGATPISEINKALELLPKEKIIGLVLNRQATPISAYYHYSYYRKKDG